MERAIITIADSAPENSLMATLYVVATPIGNLEDISLRALRVLKEVKLIAAEDTRKTRRLLTAYDIKTPMTSYYEHNKLTKLDYILSRLQGGDVALVSEAGTPGLSDPGYELILAATRNGIPVVPVPGASVVIAALTVSGLPTDRFTYLGFLPRKAGERRKLLESVAADPGTIIVLEAPHRLTDTLQDLLTNFGDRRIAVCRELTKLHEEVFRGSIGEAIERFTEPRGEFTLVVEGRADKTRQGLTEDIKSQLRGMQQSGVSAKESIARVAAATGLSRRELYKAWLEQA
jgi:16S rRNA (cytidine1402-2'-O)-methyltransferase